MFVALRQTAASANSNESINPGLLFCSAIRSVIFTSRQASLKTQCLYYFYYFECHIHVNVAFVSFRVFSLCQKEF